MDAEKSPEQLKKEKLAVMSALANVLLWLGLTVIGIALLVAFLK
jgi:hypothetical protein